MVPKELKLSFFYLSGSPRHCTKYSYSRNFHTFNSISKVLCVNLGSVAHFGSETQAGRSCPAPAEPRCVCKSLTLTHLFRSAALLCKIPLVTLRKIPLGVARSVHSFARGYSVPR